MVAIITVLIVLALLVVPNIKIVPQARCMVIERLGQYKGVWEAGIHVKIPFIDRVVSKISLKEQVLDFPPQSVITKDNVTMAIDSVVYTKVFDAKRFTLWRRKSKNRFAESHSNYTQKRNWRYGT